MSTPNYLRTVMPAEFCQADAEWIQGQIAQLPASMRNKVVVLYADAYQVAFESESVSYRQESKARREANTRLRLYVGKYHRAAMGLTEKPPLASIKAQAGVAAGNGSVQQTQDSLTGSDLSGNADQGNVFLAKEKMVGFSPDQHQKNAGQGQRRIESTSTQHKDIGRATFAGL